MQNNRKPIPPPLSEREKVIHESAEKIAHQLFKIFFTELKNTTLLSLTAPEAMSLTVDCCSMFASQAVGSIFLSVKNELSEFVTDNLIIDTINKSFRKNFECFIRLQERLNNEK